jgi:hypothetical protein
VSTGEYNKNHIAARVKPWRMVARRAANILCRFARQPGSRVVATIAARGLDIQDFPA